MMTLEHPLSHREKAFDDAKRVLSIGDDKIILHSNQVAMSAKISAEHCYRMLNTGKADL